MKKMTGETGSSLFNRDSVGVSCGGSGSLIDIEELPLIKISDAVLIDMEERGISIKVGDIIKISRNSKVAGEGYEYYRRVVL